MLTKIFVIIALITILVALFSSLIFLIRDKGKTNRPVKALTWRIALSLGLFLFLFLAFKLHWIAPHDLTPVTNETATD